MRNNTPAPGISRENRISDDGLQRLAQQLARGGPPSHPVLVQWIKRYGDPAREIIKRHGHYTADMDVI